MKTSDKIKWIYGRIYPGDRTFDNWQCATGFQIPGWRRKALKKHADETRTELVVASDEHVDEQFRKYEGQVRFIHRVLASPFLDEHEATLLFCGMEPQSTYNDEEWYSRKLQRGFPFRYDQVRRLISRAIDAGALPKQITPTSLFAFYQDQSDVDSPFRLPTIFEWAFFEHIAKDADRGKANENNEAGLEGPARKTHRAKASTSAETRLLNSAEKLAIGLLKSAYGGSARRDCNEDLHRICEIYAEHLDRDVSMALLIEGQNAHLDPEDYPIRANAESNKTTLPTGAKLRIEILLKIATAVAIDGLEYDPTKRRQDAPKVIAADLESIGLRLDPDTVRKHLKIGAQLLELGKKS